VMATQVMLDEQSLEQLVEAVEARQAGEEDDEEAILDELIREMADIRAEPMTGEAFIREDEFFCRACGMILHRTRLADRTRLICEDCLG
jgi:formamidopyrimidine-DNA glycosylase